ncbi:MAG: SufD family Fe-S cluster assembly protein [Alphaproteobacteria bacterium]|nr:SufD family Fe-S cluster assembly protein [Alphaproteobacteria bacterium]
MSYIWQDFNIKTFPAETIVFRDGLFCPELSTLDSPEISKNYDLPVHIIYVGELVGKNNLDIDIHENVKNQAIFLSARVMVNSIADFSISVKNNGMGSDLRGFVVIQNRGNVKFNADAHHLAVNTGIFIKSRLVAYKNSTSEINGVAHIYKYCDNARSDIQMSAIAEKDAKIIFRPVQKISSVPESAAHSANIAHYTTPQIEYLHQSGLNNSEIDDILKEAFINNTGW